MEIYAELRITAEILDLETITRSIGMKPSVSWKTGDFIHAGKGIHKLSRWAVRTPVLTTLDVLEAIKQLKTMTYDKAGLFARVAGQNGGKLEVACAITHGSTTTHPALWIDLETIQWLGTIGAALDIDII